MNVAQDIGVSMDIREYLCYIYGMAKRGRKPIPNDKRRGVTLPAVRVTAAEIAQLRAAAGARKLSEEIRRRLFG